MVSKYNFINNVTKYNNNYNIELLIPYKFNNFEYKVTGSEGFVQYGEYSVNKNSKIDTIFIVSVDKIQLIHVTLTLNKKSKFNDNELFDIVDMQKYFSGVNIKMDIKRVTRKVVVASSDSSSSDSDSDSSDDDSLEEVDDDSSIVEEVEEIDDIDETEIDQHAINDESILTKVIRKVLQEEMNNDAIKEVCMRMLTIIDDKSYDEAIISSCDLESKDEIADDNNINNVSSDIVDANNVEIITDEII